MKAFIKKVFLLILAYYSINSLKAQPNNIPGLVLWLNAQNVVLSSGNGVQQLTDLSGNNNHAIQSNTAKQPTLVVGEFNGFDVVRLDGVDDFMAFPEQNSIRTCFLIIKHNSGVSFDYPPILGHSVYYDFIGSTGTSLFGSTFVSPFVSTGAMKQNMVSINPLSATKPISYSLLSIVTTGNTIAQYITNDRNSFGVWNGDLAELIIYNQPLSNAQVSEVEEYLANKYAPPIELGENFTTCTLPLTLSSGGYFVDVQWQDNLHSNDFVVTAPGTYSARATDVFGRESKDTIIIGYDVLPYSVSLGMDKGFCEGDSVLVSAGPKHLQYSWSNGSNKNEIWVKTVGVYSVTVTDCFGNISSDEIVISQNSIPVFSLGSDRLFCFNKDSILSVSFGFPVTYTWQNGSHNDSIKVNNSGTYSLAVIDNNGCIYEDDVIIDFDNSLQNIDLGSDVSLCVGNEIGLISTSNAITSYYWTPTNNLQSYTTVNASGYYKLQVTNNNGCSNSDSLYVTILGDAPTVDFDYSTTCIGNLTQFNQLALAPTGNSIVSYSWNFGEPTSGVQNFSSIPNPIHSYTSAINFDVELEVETDVGCKNAITKQVTVYPLPQVDFYNYPACVGSPTTFVDISTAFNSSVQNWLWTFGNGFSSNLSSPSTLFSSSENYVVTLTVTTPQGCTNSLSKNVFVNPSPALDFSYSSLCLGTVASFTNTSIMPFPQTIQSVVWNFGDGSFGFAPIDFHSYTTAGNFDVSLEIKSSIGCTHTLTKTVLVTPVPQANFSYTNNCLNSNTLLSDISSAPFSTISKRVWEFDNTIISTLSTSSFLFNSTGNKNVKLTVTNNNGCANSVTKTIVVKPLPVASFSYSPTFVTPGETTSFINLAQNATSYTWDFGNGFGSKVYQPNTIFPDSGLYVVSFVARDEVGCKDSISKSVEVLFPKLDLGIFTLSAKVSSDNFLEIHTDLINYGTKPITSFKLLSATNSESVIRELWSGELKRGQLLPFSFSSSVKLDDADTVNAYVCVEIDRVNEMFGDDDVSNNKKCISFRADRFIVLPGFPNPPTETYTIPIILPDDGEISINVFNDLGQSVFNNYNSTGVRGLNSITIDINYLEKGLYFYQVIYKDKVARNKFIVVK